MADSLDFGSHVQWHQIFTFNGVQIDAGAGGFSGTITIGNGSPITISEMYCIDVRHDIFLNTLYNGPLTSINTQGGVTNDPWLKPEDADKIAYLISTFASAATTSAEQLALQGAIWTEVYTNYSVANAATDGYYGLKPGFSFTNTDPTVLDDYQGYLSAAAAANTSNDRFEVYWINANNGGNNAQAQVGYVEPGQPGFLVPEPSTFAMACLGAFGLVSRHRRRWITTRNQNQLA